MTVPRISIIIPMLNEAGHIGRLMADISAQDFDGEVEVLVADGGSDDDSVGVLSAAAQRFGIALTVIENPNRWVSWGLNACIRGATGDLIVRLDCHSNYPRDYLRRLAVASEATGAWNVGGVMVPEGRATTERAVACAMDSPFGGIGWTRKAGADARTEVDTVTYGAFRREAFERAGLFDETLVRNQDDELNLRLRRAGGTIVLDPSIVVTYTPRGSYRKVARQYYEYGLWKVPVMQKHGQVLSARSLAPAALVGSLGSLGVAGVVLPTARKALGAELVLYSALALAAAVTSVRARDEPPRMIPRVAAVFPSFHLGYGAGLAHGLLRALRARSRQRPV